MFNPDSPAHVSAVINRFVKAQSELDKAYDTMRNLNEFIQVNRVMELIRNRGFPVNFNVTPQELSMALEAIGAISAAVAEVLTPERISALATIRSNIGIAVGSG